MVVVDEFGFVVVGDGVIGIERVVGCVFGVVILVGDGVWSWILGIGWLVVGC